MVYSRHNYVNIKSQKRLAVYSLVPKSPKRRHLEIAGLTLFTCICDNPLPNSVCLVALTGFTIPSPFAPSPVPLLQPILASILLPNPVVCFSQRPKSFSIALDCRGNDGRGLDLDEEAVDSIV